MGKDLTSDECKRRMKEWLIIGCSEGVQEAIFPRTRHTTLPSRMELRRARLLPLWSDEDLDNFAEEVSTDPVLRREFMSMVAVGGRPPWDQE
jgi:hypothetical protein